MLCGSAALLSAAIATIVFHSYRAMLTTDRLATELTAQAHAIAPLAADRLEAGDMAGAARLLRSFAGPQYVTCVEMVQDGAVMASFPRQGCEAVSTRGNESDISVTTPSGESLLFRVRVDDRLLMVWVETALVGGLMIALATVIFIVLSLGFRARVLAPLVVLRTAMQASTPNNPVRADLLHEDEIGAIVKAYNSLVAAARLFFRAMYLQQQAGCLLTHTLNS